MKTTVFLFLSLFLFQCSTPSKVKEGPSATDEMENLLMTNIFNIETFRLPSGLQVMNEQGKKVAIDNLFLTPKLVVRLDYSCCEKCIQAEIEKIHTLFQGQAARHVIAIASYEAPRSILAVKKQLNLKFPIFFLPVQEGEYIFPNSLTNLHYPYVFTVDEELKAHHLFVPSSTLPDVSDTYYGHVYEILNTEKQPDYRDLFRVRQMDAGKMKINTEHSFRFSYTNHSDQPILINDIKTTCGCTVPNWNKSPLLPGKTAELVIKFNPNTVGFHAKKIFVYINKSNNPIPLLIKAMVME